MNKILKICVTIAMAVMLSFAISACSATKVEADNNITPEVSAPGELTEDEMLEVIEHYAARLTSRLNNGGKLTVGFIVNPDGTCEFTSFVFVDDTEVPRPKLLKFESIKDCYDFLINSELIDANGNVLI